MEDSDNKQEEQAATRAEARGKARPAKLALRAGAFVVAALLLLAFLSRVTTPSLGQEPEGVRGFYRLPPDSAQVAFVGVSSSMRAFSPNVLYGQQGISAYNCCTGDQQMIASFSLVKSLKRAQPGLSLVILDATCLARDSADYHNPAYAERVVEGMPLFSPERLELVSNLANEYEDYGFLEHLVPVFAYHDRWKELNGKDFEKSLGVCDRTYARGQFVSRLSFESNVSRGTSGSYTGSTNDAITEERELSDAELKDVLNHSNERYFRQIVDYCSESGLELLLVKTPSCSWSDTQHDAVALLAEECDVPFLDMSVADIREDACGLSYDSDYYDSTHMNLQGSLKASAYLGDYLKEHYELDDARESAAHDAFDADLQRFSADVEDAGLLPCDSLEEYLDRLQQDRYTVFIAVNGEAAQGLSEEARAKAAELGLKKLSQLAPNESYAGVLCDGRCLKETVSEKGSEISLSGFYQDGKAFLESDAMQDGASIGTKFTLSSCGADSGARAAIKMESKDKSENKRGINFVVYDSDLRALIDNSSFDTHVGSARTSDVGGN